MHPGGGQAPSTAPGDDERLAAHAVAEPACERRDQHVGDEERGGERSHLLIGRAEFALDQRNLAGKNVAVDVVEQVEGEQKEECAQGGMQSRRTEGLNRSGHAT